MFHPGHEQGLIFLDKLYQTGNAVPVFYFFPRTGQRESRENRAIQKR